MDILSNPVVVSMAQLAWGFAVKYLPALANVPNKYIPWMNVLLGFLMKLTEGTATVHPALYSAAFEPFQAAGFFSSSLFTKLFDAAWSAMLMALVSDKLAKPMLVKDA
jgi:hypothetical protein